MDPIIRAVFVAGSLFLGILVCLEIGFAWARRRSSNDPSAHEGIAPVETAIFALLGLLLGFSFSGGTSRLEFRRQLIVQEVNAIGTAYLRLDILPDADQPKLRQLFREYLDTRLLAYEKLPDLDRAQQGFSEAEQIQLRIWSSAITSARGDPSGGTSRLLLPALNEMFDVAKVRTIALYTHVPGLIFDLLIALTVLSGLLAGYAMGKRRDRSWLHRVIYSLVVSVVIYTVMDLDNPRNGLIRLDVAEHSLVDLRDSLR